jgi:hypothetical protein
MSNTNELKLTYEKKTVYEQVGEDVIQAAYAYSEGYKNYLDICKTEREALKHSIAMAEAAGYREYQFGDSLVVGGKYYYNGVQVKPTDKMIEGAYYQYQ